MSARRPGGATAPGAARVELELPEAWRPLPLAGRSTGGERQAARALVRSWLAEQGAAAADDAVTRPVVDRLVREARRAARDGVAFAAVLLELLPEADVLPKSELLPEVEVRPGDGRLRALVTGSLAVSFRSLPGAGDPAVAAEGVLATLRRGAAPTRRTGLVGLGRDPGRPAVLLREQRQQDGVPLSTSQVLWLVPGTTQLASVSVATCAQPLAAAFTEVALGVAAALRVRLPQAVPGCAGMNAGRTPARSGPTAVAPP